VLRVCELRVEALQAWKIFDRRIRIVLYIRVADVAHRDVRLHKLRQVTIGASLVSGQRGSAVITRLDGVVRSALMTSRARKRAVLVAVVPKLREVYVLILRRRFRLGGCERDGITVRHAPHAEERAR